ncbi:SRPBCC family protein [Portibacter marinus]|uniref:hypothetical protein n=1 Tax=Portibacter marinus TaxID=2898660 RepID=UPI001F2CAA43|nr:hypothetical protein [Portibacter marinus]
MEKNVTPILRNVFLGVLVLFLLLCLMAWIFSPYKDKVVSHVGIDMPCEAAFDYLGNSDNASDWSSFVPYIETINEDKVADGMVGSKRKCYTEWEKEGFQWEEEVLERIEDKYRKLSCYNYKNLWLRAPDLVTEQIYSQTDYGCKVSFTLDFMYKPSFWDLAKMKYSAFRIKSIFDKNLKNIKKEVYKRRP